jgi:hypothetical protein
MLQLCPLLHSTIREHVALLVMAQNNFPEKKPPDYGRLTTLNNCVFVVELDGIEPTTS